MIEAISGTKSAGTSAEPARGAEPGMAFALDLAANLAAVGVELPTDPALTNRPVVLGRDVNLASLAKDELKTAGTLRASVAAAREEARSAKEAPVSEPRQRGASTEGPGDGPLGSQRGTISDGMRGERPVASAMQANAARTRDSASANAIISPPTSAAGTAGVAAKLTAPSVLVASVAGVAAVRAVSGGGGTGQPGDARAMPGGRAMTTPTVFKAVPAGRPAPGAPETFTAQLKRGLAAVLRQNGGSVTVRLAPASLGPVRIQMELQDGQVSARFDVAGSEARRLLESNLGVLRDTLEARGLRVDDLHVSIRPELAGSKEGLPDPGGPAARDASPEPRTATGGAGEGGGDAGAHPRGPRQEADPERDHPSPTIDPWEFSIGGAATDQQGPVVLRLRLDTVA
jgi:hypothetical protein